MAFDDIGRRDALKALAAFGLAGAGAPAFGAGGSNPELGPARPFDFDILTATAERMSRETYQPPRFEGAEILQRIDFDAHWRIRFRDDATLTPAGPAAPVQFFHPGRFFPAPVRMHVVADGAAREVLFDRAYFDMPKNSPAQALKSAGFAGFRVMRPGLDPDWVSFLGASYFRTDGPFRQYGLSARGLAIDTGLPRPEEFPRFSAFWLGAPEREGEDLVAWALLDSPSVVGAYRFGLAKDRKGGGHRTDVSARLFMRKAVERLGVAPLTSMYWFSERDRVIADDWRPEIHDSDGLALWTGDGERIWRALDNPTSVTTSSFLDRNPKGFGLIQRDRRFADYQDDGAFYDRRPSAWVEPRGEWGKGAVQLVQIPTHDETFDNIVAYWTPERAPEAGEALSFEYGLSWIDRDPAPDAVASVVATRQGQGGVPGQPIPDEIDKMIVEFEGPALDGLDRESGVEPVVEASGGVILDPVAVRPVVGTDRWRLSFDFRTTGAAPAVLRAYLRKDGAPLTETWLAQAQTQRARRPRR